MVQGQCSQASFIATLSSDWQTVYTLCPENSTHWYAVHLALDHAQNGSHVHHVRAAEHSRISFSVSFSCEVSARRGCSSLLLDLRLLCNHLLRALLLFGVNPDEPRVLCHQLSLPPKIQDVAQCNIDPIVHTYPCTLQINSRVFYDGLRQDTVSAERQEKNVDSMSTCSTTESSAAGLQPRRGRFLRGPQAQHRARARPNYSAKLEKEICR